MVVRHPCSVVSANSAQPHLSRRTLAWVLNLSGILLLAALGTLEWIAHRSSPVHLALTPLEIQQEDARLKYRGLIIRDGSLLKERPFEPPWTSHSLLMPSQWFSRSSFVDAGFGSHRVRADLLLRDLDTLEAVMERAYGGWDSATRRGWDWERWFSDWRRQLSVKGATEMSLDEAFSPVDQLLAFQRDNHTQIPLERSAPANGDGSQTTILNDRPSAPCDQIRAGNHDLHINASDPAQGIRSVKQWTSVAASLEIAHYVTMPRSYGVPQAVRCGTAWISLQRVGNRTSGIVRLLRRLSKEDQPRIERLGGGVIYARLPTFTSNNYEHLSKRRWADPRPEDKVLIVDLRGNGGGSHEYGIDALDHWIDRSRFVPWEALGKRITSSCLYAPLRWNEEMVLDPGFPPSQLKFLQETLNALASPYPADCPRTVNTTPATWSYSQHRFDPRPGSLRIVALVNSDCGSDCELFALELASLPETLIAGVNTFGVGQFIQPGYSVLPRTGLMYRIALGQSDFYGDNRSYDGYGLDVDILLPEIDYLRQKQLRDFGEVVARM